MDQLTSEIEVILGKAFTRVNEDNESSNTSCYCPIPSISAKE